MATLNTTSTKTNIKALLIDDEQRALNVLRLLILHHIPAIGKILLANGATEGIRLIKKEKPDLVFLDIQMPFMDGFELLQEVQGEHTFEVIFTTAYSEYAIRAIRSSAIDYLLKPIQVEDLIAAVSRYQAQNRDQSEWQKLYQNLVHNLQHQEEQSEHRLALPSQEGTFFLNIADIIRCEASSNYTLFFMKDKKKYVASKTLKEYESILQEHDFIRVHKSHLINKKQVKGILGDQLLMSDDSKVEISRRRKAWVLHELGQG